MNEFDKKILDADRNICKSIPRAEGATSAIFAEYHTGAAAARRDGHFENIFQSPLARSQRYAKYKMIKIKR